MLFYSFFKTLVGKEITLELKNDLCITGTLHSVDQYMNIKINNIRLSNPEKYPHMAAVLPPGSVDLELLHDATRREARGG